MRENRDPRRDDNRQQALVRRNDFTRYRHGFLT
jgi:hypothetical protein